MMEAGLLPPGLLAYIGDSVYELQARNWLLHEGSRTLNKIHNETIGLVNATAQARGLRAIEPILSEEEKSIVRRGRNTKTGSTPKNVDMGDYRLSTGLEALFGYHYLNNNTERIKELWSGLIKELRG